MIFIASRPQPNGCSAMQKNICCEPPVRVHIISQSDLCVIGVVLGSVAQSRRRRILIVWRVKSKSLTHMSSPQILRARYVKFIRHAPHMCAVSTLTLMLSDLVAWQDGGGLFPHKSPHIIINDDCGLRTRGLSIKHGGDKCVSGCLEWHFTHTHNANVAV